MSTDETSAAWEWGGGYSGATTGGGGPPQAAFPPGWGCRLVNACGTALVTASSGGWHWCVRLDRPGEGGEILASGVAYYSGERGVRIAQKLCEVMLYALARTPDDIVVPILIDNVPRSA